MTQPEHIYREATRRGLHLKSVGDKLAVSPAKNCTPDFAEILRQHKPQLVAWLDAQSAGLPPDTGPWLHIARQILAGEFDGADRYLTESLVIGLRSIEHPDCRRALAYLNTLTPIKKRKRSL